MRPSANERLVPRQAMESRRMPPASPVRVDDDDDEEDEECVSAPTRDSISAPSSAGEKDSKKPPASALVRHAGHEPSSPDGHHRTMESARRAPGLQPSPSVNDRNGCARTAAHDNTGNDGCAHHSPRGGSAINKSPTPSTPASVIETILRDLLPPSATKDREDTSTSDDTDSESGSRCELPPPPPLVIGDQNVNNHDGRAFSAQAETVSVARETEKGDVPVARETEKGDTETAERRNHELPSDNGETDSKPSAALPSVGQDETVDDHHEDDNLSRASSVQVEESSDDELPHRMINFTSSSSPNGDESDDESSSVASVPTASSPSGSESEFSPDDDDYLGPAVEDDEPPAGVAGEWKKAEPTEPTSESPQRVSLGSSADASVPAVANGAMLETPPRKQHVRRSSRERRQTQRMTPSRHSPKKHRHRKKKRKVVQRSSQVYALASAETTDWEDYDRLVRKDDTKRPAKRKRETPKQNVPDAETSTAVSDSAPKPSSTLTESAETENNLTGSSESRVFNVERANGVCWAELQPLSAWDKEGARCSEALESIQNRIDENVEFLAECLSMVKTTTSRRTARKAVVGVDPIDSLNLDQLEDEMQMMVPAFITGDHDTCKEVFADRSTVSQPTGLMSLNDHADAWARKHFSLPEPGTSILTETELELAWLGEESVYSLRSPTWDWTFIWLHASSALKEAILDQNTTVLVRPQVSQECRRIRSLIRNALHCGYRRPSMNTIIARHHQVLRQQQHEGGKTKYLQSP